MERGTMKVLCVVATLALSTLLAACGGVDVSGRSTNEDIQFGIWQPDEDGAMRFKATADVPNEEDQAYGWRVRVAESEQSVKWIESVTLPETPDSWEGVQDDPSVMISEDGRTATTVGVVVPDGGYLENVWFVSIGDPPGEYEMSVELSDGRQASFTFRLSEAADVASGTASQGT